MAFARLGLFDRVATPDPALWEALARRYGLSGRQRIVTKNAGPAAMEELVTTLAGRGEEDGTSAKAAYRARRTVLEPRFVAASLWQAVAPAETVAARHQKNPDYLSQTSSRLRG